MSLLQLFSNNAISLLEVSLSPSSTTLVVQPGLGASFPQPVNPGEFFLITLEDIAAPLTREIIKITGRSGDILTIGARGLEGTSAASWTSHNTLVDHRITAETIRQAFLQPVAPVIPPSSGSGGYSYSPVTVQPSLSEGVATVTYSQDARGNKFWVSMYSPFDFAAQSFEVLTIVQGNVNANAELVTWTKSNRIGYNFQGSLIISLNTSNKELSIIWHNTEPLTPVKVSVVRI